MKKINVTQTYLPPFEEYERQLKRAWDSKWITNNGELVRELEERLKEYLGVKHLFFTSNGTVVLQMAIKAMGLTGEIITTPFSYVATTNAILWEGCTPVFADIDPVTFNLDPSQIERVISSKTQAILATHVYGIPCDIEAIQRIADKYGLKVIYDGAHAFGCTFKQKALLSYGDISTCSFHATKVFHTVEGGCVITSDDHLAEKLRLYRSFGHIGDDYYDIGINGKNSEFHAAMGLAVLPHMEEIIEKRKQISLRYDQGFEHKPLLRPDITQCSNYNYSYYPIVFETHERMKGAMEDLVNQNIYCRRYFYPALNTLPFLEEKKGMPISEDIASRILCIPIYPDLDTDDVDNIIRTINSSL